jgi:type II secretory pathway pseudopilin PulG
MSNLRAPRTRAESGFTLLEIVTVLAVGIIIAGVGLPYMNRTLAYMKLSGVARSVANATGAVKIRSAAKYTRARLFVDRSGNSYHLEILDTSVTPLPPAGGHWVADGGTTYLPTNVLFSTGAVTSPPLNTQPVAQFGMTAFLCTDDNLVVIGNTSCIMFNSRGVPVKDDGTGNPTDWDALYISDGTNVYAVTILATGFIGTWHTPSQPVPTWVVS